MKFGLSNTTLNKIITVLKKYPSIDKVIIYGSRAIGNYKNGSDIDLTFFGKLTEQEWSKIYTALDDLLLPYSFDLSLYEQIDNENLKAHIKTVGKVFYLRPQI